MSAPRVLPEESRRQRSDMGVTGRRHVAVVPAHQGAAVLAGNARAAEEVEARHAQTGANALLGFRTAANPGADVIRLERLVNRVDEYDLRLWRTIANQLHRPLDAVGGRRHREVDVVAATPEDVRAVMRQRRNPPTARPRRRSCKTPGGFSSSLPEEQNQSSRLIAITDDHNAISARTARCTDRHADLYGVGSAATAAATTTFPVLRRLFG